ncbi:threonine/homoserine efflux transporter RhtA [Lentzea atacamensis]|uniref:Threonine/homoserine efflux transporter RhtA n=1 Tax=Lentzea atacamensis TaxID=531938 RepID=A0A316HJ43_9PSEU|nr:DMT family transporter [Lentzea atacamensis]PWK81243.1 threonine/homoserine efflux transporter RhtA [Lentzea atacamensis]
MGIGSKSTGLIAAAISFISFGTSGAFVKPLLDAGWSPTAAVTARALTAGLVLLPFVVVSLRGKWDLLLRARWPVLGMGLVGVAITQVFYFAAIQRIPVATALLVEFLAPIILVGFTWAVTRRTPAPVVLFGSALAVGGLVLVIGPGAIQAVDPIGLALAFGAAIGCSVYFVIAARPNEGLPPVALAGTGLLLAAPVLALVGATGLLPFTATFDDLPLLGTTTAWWVPLLVVAVIGTALAYASGITASGILGSRLASFIALLEVVSASLFAWLLLGQRLSPWQLVGGLLILAGIASVRAERQRPEPVAAPPVGVFCS